MTRSARMSSSIRALIRPGLTPVHSPVHDQQAEIADRFGADETDDERSSTRPPSSSSPKLDETAERRVRAGRAAGRRRAGRRSSGSGAAPCAAPRARARKQGQGGVHAPPRSRSSSQAPARLRRRRPLGAAARDRRARPAARAHARTRRAWPQRPNARDKYNDQAAPLRLRRFARRARLDDRRLRGAASQRAARGFGGKADGDVGLATRALLALNSNDVPTRDRPRRARGREDARRCRLPGAARQCLFRRRPLPLGRSGLSRIR